MQSNAGTYIEAIKYVQKPSVDTNQGSHSNEDGCRRSKRIPNARSAYTPPEETKERKKTAEYAGTKKATKVVEEPDVPKGSFVFSAFVLFYNDLCFRNYG